MQLNKRQERGRSHAPRRTLGIDWVYMGIEVIPGNKRGQATHSQEHVSLGKRRAIQDSRHCATYHLGFPQAFLQLYIFVPM